MKDIGSTPFIDDIEISENLAEFYSIRKHYLILTDAGKPIYSRYGDENNLSHFFATLSAVIPKILSYFWDNNRNARENNNKIHMLRSKIFRVYFLRKGSLIYICLYNSSERCPRGAFFLDDLQLMANRHNRKANHILEEELKPKPVRETDSFV
jgi:hypothetical protein